MLNWKKKQEKLLISEYAKKGATSGARITLPVHREKSQNPSYIPDIAIEKESRTLHSSSSMTPPALCHTFAAARMSAMQHAETNEMQVVYSHSMVLFEMYLDLLLSEQYGADRDAYEIVPFYNRELDTFAFQIMMSAKNPVLEEGYFDPDLDEQAKEFLSDLEDCLVSDDVVIDHDTLSFEILNKMSLYRALYNLMSSDHKSISTPDRYQFRTDILDPEIENSQLYEAMRENFHDACDMVKNGDDDILFLTAANEPYMSREHYLARAGLSNNVDLFMPLNALLSAIRDEDGVSPPMDYQDQYASYYNFN